MPSCAIPSATSTRAELLAEHRALRETLDALALELARVPEGPSSTWVERVAERIRTLRQQLPEHFAHEERSGLFEQLRSMLPESAPRCERLVRQHAWFEQRLDGVARYVRRMAPRSWVPELRGLLADLARHEAEENELLFRTVDPEPGAPD
jgi:hypothetical protein